MRGAAPPGIGVGIKVGIKVDEWRCRGGVSEPPPFAQRQEALGHSTIAVTLDLYSHVVPSLQKEAGKEMGAALFG